MHRAWGSRPEAECPTVSTGAAFPVIEEEMPEAPRASGPSHSSNEPTAMRMPSPGATTAPSAKRVAAKSWPSTSPPPNQTRKQLQQRRRSANVRVRDAAQRLWMLTNPPPATPMNTRTLGPGCFLMMTVSRLWIGTPLTRMERPTCVEVSARPAATRP